MNHTQWCMDSASKGCVDPSCARIAELEAERDEQMDKAIGAWQLLGAADMQIEHLTHNLSISDAKVAKAEARLAEANRRADENRDLADKLDCHPSPRDPFDPIPGEDLTVWARRCSDAFKSLRDELRPARDAPEDVHVDPAEPQKPGATSTTSFGFAPYTARQRVWGEVPR